MDSLGITPQYGFLYQRYRYIYCLIKELNHYDYLTFEGADDIEENLTDNSLFAINNSSILIQVKTGNVDKGTCYKIFGNWLKTDVLNCVYKLYCEKTPTVSFDDNFITDFIKEVERSAGCRDTKILKQVYNKFYFNGKLQQDDIKVSIKKIIASLSIEEKDIESLLKETSIIYKNNFTAHIKIYDELKDKCFMTFLNQINAIIDDNLSNKRNTKLSTNDINNIIVTIATELTDNKYNIDIEEFSTKAQSRVKEIIKHSNLREIQQLKFISNDEKFITKNIVNKLLYDDFRQVYNNSISIKNIEFSAFNNYENVLEELLEKERTPYNLYKKTTAIPIIDELLPRNEMYYKGCYIFLTSDNAPTNKLISWKVKDD